MKQERGGPGRMCDRPCIDQLTATHQLQQTQPISGRDQLGLCCWIPAQEIDPIHVI